MKIAISCLSWHRRIPVVLMAGTEKSYNAMADRCKDKIVLRLTCHVRPSTQEQYVVPFSQGPFVFRIQS